MVEHKQHKSMHFQVFTIRPMCFHKSLLLWQLVWMDALSDYDNKVHNIAKHNLGLLDSNFSATCLGMREVY